MSSSTEPARPPRPPHRGLSRVLVGYLSTALALACGIPAVVIGWIAGNHCSDEGFRCLGYFFYGLFGAAALALIAFPLIAHGFRLGAWFILLTLVLVIAPVMLSSGSSTGGTAFLGPGLAAWISEPPDAPVTDRLRHWGPRFGAALVCSVLIPLVGRLV